MNRLVARIAALPFVLFVAPAMAHSGHLAEEAGHSHFLALGAVASAVAIVAISIARRLVRKRKAALNG